MGWSLLCDGLLGDGRDCSGYCHEGGHRHNCRCHVCGGLLWLVSHSAWSWLLVVSFVYFYAPTDHRTVRPSRLRASDDESNT